MLRQQRPNRPHRQKNAARQFWPRNGRSNSIASSAKKNRPTATHFSSKVPRRKPIWRRRFPASPAQPMNNPPAIRMVAPTRGPHRSFRRRHLMDRVAGLTRGVSPLRRPKFPRILHPLHPLHRRRRPNSYRERPAEPTSRRLVDTFRCRPLEAEAMSKT